MTASTLDETRGYVFKTWIGLLRLNLPPEQRLAKLFETIAPATPTLPGQYREWKSQFQSTHSRGPSEDESLDFIASVLTPPS